MKILLLFLLVLNLSLLTAVAEEETSLGTVLVEDRRIDYPLNYPSAFSTSLYLDRFRGEFNTTSDILSLSPGVVVRDYGGFGQLKTVSVRGSSSNQVVVLLDGLRLNNPLSGGVDLSTIPVQYLETIEVIRGGGSAFAGSDAIGGIINLKTKPASRPLTLASLTYGSFDTVSLNLSTAGTKGSFNYLVSFNHSQSNGDFEFKSVNEMKLERINNEYKSDSLLLKMDYSFDDMKISLLNEFYHDDKGVPGLGEFQEDSSNQKDLRNLTSIKLEKTGLFSPDTDLESTIYHKYERLEFSDPDPQVGLPVDTDSRLSTTGFINRLQWYRAANHTVTFSAELTHQKLDDENFNDPSRTNIGLFTGHEFTFVNKNLSVSPLFRFDYYHTKRDDSDNETGFSPKLGIIYSIANNLHLKGNISYSHRVPNFSELFFPEQRFIGGNPDLDKEISLDFDIGFSYALPSLVFEVSYFRSQIEDSIMFVFINSQRIEPRNVGDVTQQGVEANIIYRPIRYLDLSAGYTYLDGEIEDTGAQLPGRPENKLDLRAVFEYSVLNLFWEMHFVDEIPLSPFRNSRTTDARTVHDVGAKINWDKYFVTIEAKNVFNNLDVRDSFDFPLPGRSVYLTAGIRY